MHSWAEKTGVEALGWCGCVQSMPWGLGCMVHAELPGGSMPSSVQDCHADRTAMQIDWIAVQAVTPDAG